MERARSTSRRPLRRTAGARPRRGPAVLAALLVVALAGGSTTVATAGPSASAFVVQAFEWKVAGQYTRLWQAIDPVDRKGLSRSRWLACERQERRAIAGVKVIGVEALRERTVTRTFVPIGKIRATDVTIRIRFRVGGKQEHTDSDLYVRRSGVSWSALLASPTYEAIAAGSCPGAGSDSTPAAGKAAPKAGGGGAHTMSAYWFSITTRFPGASAFTGYTNPPTNPSSLDAASQGTIDYYGPGKGTGRVTITAFGPIRTYSPRETLAKVAAARMSGLQVLKGPTHYRLGGKPALAYYATDGHGNEVGEVVAWIPNGPDWGLYGVSLSASPKRFNAYTNAVVEVMKSFRFLH